MVKIASLSPDDYGSGRWDGGKFTITDSYLKYRTGKGSKGEFTIIEHHVVFEDANGEPHDIPLFAASAEKAVIRETADEDAEEAPKGLALSHRDPESTYVLGRDSESAQFLASLVNHGFPKSKLATGDYSVIIGVEGFAEMKPRKEGDKFPFPICTQITGGVKGGKSKAKAADDDEGPRRRRAAADADDEPKTTSRRRSAEDDDEPAQRRSSKKKGEPTPESRLLEIIAEELEDESAADGLTAEDIVKVRRSFKGEEFRSEMIELLNDRKWLAAQDAFEYEAKTKLIKRAS